MKYRSSKKIFSFLYFSIGSLIAAIFVGLFLLYCVYMLPTARMRYNVNRSLTYIQAENDSYMWAPYQKSSALDGFTDSIMLGNAIYESKFSALHDALVNPRMEFTPGILFLWIPLRNMLPVRPVAKKLPMHDTGMDIWSF